MKIDGIMRWPACCVKYWVRGEIVTSAKNRNLQSLLVGRSGFFNEVKRSSCLQPTQEGKGTFSCLNILSIFLVETPTSNYLVPVCSYDSPNKRNLRLVTAA